MYYLIISAPSHLPANQQHISFSETAHDVCFGHTKPDIVANYTLANYLTEFGNEVIDGYTRDENYRLVPCCKTVAESLSEWNYGAQEFSKAMAK